MFKKTIYPSFFLQALAFLALVTAAAHASEAGPWSLEKDDAGIKVFLRDSPAHDMPTIRGEFVAAASTSQIVEALGDGEECPGWSHDCIKNVVIERVSENDFYAYSIHDMPWPLSDIDIVTRVTITPMDERNTQVIIQSVADKYPATNYERLETIITIDLVAMGENATQVKYQEQIQVEAGTVELFLANLIIPYVAHRDLLGLKRVSEGKPL
jgi:hypothetical protein